MLNPHPPSSTASSTDPTLPTPADEPESYSFGRTVTSEPESPATGLGVNAGSEAARSKRPSEEGEGPKKKRRIALTHLGGGEGS